ncbi:hypothetical protein GCM10008019_45680 [Deinococcus soli (ex Cha et al. 2016)]|nr:hypothetical protein GCM10008019_45680 [Deinococcus soli (ex Cha et al. 2016)]
MKQIKTFKILSSLFTNSTRNDYTINYELTGGTNIFSIISMLAGIIIIFY